MIQLKKKQKKTKNKKQKEKHIYSQRHIHKTFWCFTPVQ